MPAMREVSAFPTRLAAFLMHMGEPHTRRRCSPTPPGFDFRRRHRLDGRRSSEQKTKNERSPARLLQAHMLITHQPTTGSPHSCACTCRRAARAMRAACKRGRVEAELSSGTLAWGRRRWREQQRHFLAARNVRTHNGLSFQLQHLVSFCTLLYELFSQRMPPTGYHLLPPAPL